MTAAEEFISKIKNLTKNDFIAETITPLEELKEKSTDHMKCKIELFVTHLQAVVINKLREYESSAEFNIDRWNREEGGGGISCVLQDGEVFEKAGVNISVVWGNMHPEQVKSMKSRGKDLVVEGKNTFFATGISCVLHPVNPFIPTLHFNYRYFEVLNESTGKIIWWFGGGIDMTPNYLIEEDVLHFHTTQKNACDKHNKEYYPRFKKWADEYFYNVHRKEHRGVGGTFFDDFDEESIDACFSFVATCGTAVLPSFIPIVDQRRNNEFTKQQREWQLVRRGRYVEFNLVYDRGTKFGLATPGARIESVLISLPLVARWEYMHEIKDGSPEDILMKVLKQSKDWA